MRRLNEERGFTIVECIVAATILLTGILGTMAMLDTASKRSRGAGDRQKAVAVAREVLEVAKSIPYRDAAPDTIVALLRNDSTIAGSSGSPWQIDRDGTRYTVTTDVCWIDEPADKLGPRSAGNFCSGSGSGGTGDSNPIDFKRVTVTVSWRDGAGTGSTSESTLISAKGGSDAPAVDAVRMTSPSSAPITDPAATSASFVVNTATDANSVVWSIDGTQRGAASGSGRNWTFTWALPAYDGVYDVSAQALEASGLAGESRSITVVVNRFAPFAPTNVNAGRNGSVVEVEWSANRGRDVIGYRVYRQPKAGTATVVCDMTTALSCVDTSPPASSGTALEYWVVALDRDPNGNTREGTPSARIDVNLANRPPNAPVALTLSKDAQGQTILRWQAAQFPDPDTGDSIASYRIYRDGTAIGDRYDRVDGTQLMATDARASGVTHKYWVTAVDTHLAESSALGPVTG